MTVGNTNCTAKICEQRRTFAIFEQNGGMVDHRFLKITIERSILSFFRLHHASNVRKTLFGQCRLDLEFSLLPHCCPHCIDLP